ncbi:hypothetical protein [uncultured Rubinisphaera sp.]|uniref:hypothetical protein n=1 Tax=uncultured Rubinisphaera sp. TaxID=1678686 RepID=UPI0030DC3270|tara:strand:- start:355 stop:1203 length:849 start_codon:yes stop_codon:yes gene_type:complete
MLFHVHKQTLSLTIAFVVAGFILMPAAIQAGKLSQRPIRKLTYDPKAEKVELFEGIENEVVEYTMIMKDSKEGTLFLENKTDEVISVEMPKAIVGIQVLAQFDDGLGGGTGGAGGAGGGQQPVGGGAGGGGGIGGFDSGAGGGGFFSIPANKMIAVPLNTVCLEHGKKEPTPVAEFKLVKPEEYTENVALQELLVMIASGKVNKDVAQAAAWHLNNDMSWAELASKTENNYGAAGPRRVFSNAHLYAAQNLVALAVGKAREEQTDEPATTTPRTSRVSRIQP